MFIELLFLFFLTILIIHFLFSIAAEFKGAPFVPTSKKHVQEILELANLKKGQFFLDLGSGEGRVVREAVSKYQVFGVGFELNPILFLIAKIISKIEGISNAKFIRKNFFKVSFSKADVIYFFLKTKTVEKLQKKLLEECKPNTLIISHGFELRDFKKYQVNKIPRKYFSTYFYRLNIK